MTQDLKDRIYCIGCGGRREMLILAVTPQGTFYGCTHCDCFNPEKRKDTK